MKKKIFISFLLIAQILKSQNLVPDPGFEFCKTFGDTTWVTPAPIDGNLENWFTNTGHGNARYYNVNAKSFSCNMCPGGRTIQYHGAHNGNGYSDFAIFNIGMGETRDTISLSFNSGTLCTRLSHTLEKGEKYKIEMYVRLDSSCVYASNHIGIVISDTVRDNWPSGDQIIALYPDSYKDSILTNQATGKIIHTTNRKYFLDNTVEWQHVSGIYTAKGGEKYLCIGGLCNQTVIEPVSRKLRNYQCTEADQKREKKSCLQTMSKKGNPYIIYDFDDVSLTRIN